MSNITVTVKNTRTLRAVVPSWFYNVSGLLNFHVVSESQYIPLI